MKLNVVERLALLETLPKEGNFVTLKLVRKLRESLSFSEAEVKEIEFNLNWKCPKCNKETSSAEAPKCECGSYMTSTGGMTWDAQKGSQTLKEIHMGEKMLSMCVTALKKLDSENKLNESYFSLYEKFIKEEENTE
jgi:hypothetical protein